METKENKLVGGLTQLECNMQDMHLKGYDKHLGIAGLNRYNRRRRIQRIKEVVWSIVPYVVAGLLILILMHVGG